MSGGLNPMSQQNVPSPSFQASQMNQAINPNMMPVSNMVHGPVAPTNQVQVSAPQSHPQSSSNQSSSSSSSSPTSSQHDLNRLKNLVSSLRENLKNFYLISSMNLEYNIQIDNLNKNLEQPFKLERSLEDILALCNQIELCLRTILECAIQLRDSQNFLPFQVSHDFHLDAASQPPMMNNLGTRSYSDYLNVIKKQVAYSKSIYEILADSIKQIKHNDQSQQQQLQQQQPPPTLPPTHHHVPQPPPPSQQINPQLIQSMQQQSQMHQQQQSIVPQHPQLLSTQMQHSGNI